MPFISPANWRPQGVDDLEPNAWAALRHPGSTCVIAGPGAGKTEFLAQRASFLLQTGTCPPPYHVLAISFKKDAARNLAERVALRCPAEQANRFVSMTFDSFTKGLVDRFLPAIPATWRPTRPYDVVLPKKRDVQQALDIARFEAPVAWQSDIAGISASTFEAQQVGGRRLSIPVRAPASASDFAVESWWRQYLRHPRRSLLTFVMLNRLAELLVRVNVQLLRALRVTYPFVFVDEFQDTTYAQYDFLSSAFSGGSNIVTVVGDDKQRIMVWAGARVDAFAKFESEFQARRVPLMLNFRSSPDLVRIQHVVALALDGQAQQTTAKTARVIAGDVSQVWTFGTEAVESKTIAEWLSDDIRKRGTAPRDYAILVRQTADRFEGQLSADMARRGLRLRNESKLIGKTTLQDLLAEELTRVGLAVLRLSIARRAPDAWTTAQKAILRIRDVDHDDEVACQQAEAGLVAFRDALRSELVGVPSSAAANLVVDHLFTFLDLAAVAQSYAAYGTGDALDIAAEAFRLHFVSCTAGASTWAASLDAFEGSDSVPLMTVHKSKGLEYDTILFVGLDDNMWWSHRRGDPEGVATFFVALSRAKQRAIFTFCKDRGPRVLVGELYQLLTNAGVPEVAY